MRSADITRVLGSGSSLTILAQRFEGRFRAAICCQRSESSEQTERIVVMLDRFDAKTCRYDTVFIAPMPEWNEAVAALSKLKDAVPEAARALNVETTFLKARAA